MTTVKTIEQKPAIQIIRQLCFCGAANETLSHVCVRSAQGYGNMQRIIEKWHAVCFEYRAGRNKDAAHDHFRMQRTRVLAVQTDSTCMSQNLYETNSSTSKLSCLLHEIQIVIQGFIVCGSVDAVVASKEWVSIDINR